jgi:hypothetical protein
VAQDRNATLKRRKVGGRRPLAATVKNSKTSGLRFNARALGPRAKATMSIFDITGRTRKERLRAETESL